MMESLASSFRRCSRETGHEKFIRRVILPAIQGQTCRICFETLEPHRAAVLSACRHAFCSVCIRRWSTFKRKCPLCNTQFDSWFHDVDLSSRRFRRERLPPPRKEKSVISQSGDRRRTTRRPREELNGITLRSRPLPWRRSFGQPGSVPAYVMRERRLQWRARCSVYNQRLVAVPMSSRFRMEQWTDHAKVKKLQRIEPWIRRDLQAILGDLDPSVIVHLALPLFVKSLDRKFDASSGQTCVCDGVFSPLRQFLLEKTDMFSHELRCFAESSLNMETYDAVIEYKQGG